MLSVRRLTPIAFVAAIHSVALSTALPAFAQTGKPAAAAKPQQDLIGRGQALFEDQQYEESIQTLSGALVRPNNTKAQKIEIYRLLALNYITLNHKDEAESAVRGLLAIEPAYTLPSSESPRFRDFFASVKQKWEAEGRPGLVKETAAPPPPVTMKHNSPSEAVARHQIDLTARVDDPQGRVVEVKLYYRAGSKGPFEALNTTYEEGSVRVTIPGNVVRPPLVEYYFQGVDKGGLPVVSRGDATAPFRVAIPEGSKAWVIPVAIGSSIVGTAAIVGILAAAGAFKSSGSGGKGPGTEPGAATVNVSVGETWHR